MCVHMYTWYTNGVYVYFGVGIESHSLTWLGLFCLLWSLCLSANIYRQNELTGK